MKKLSLLMLVLSLLSIIGINAYASENIDTSNNNQEINTNENEAINKESNQGNQEGESSDNDVNNGENSLSDDNNQSSIQYDDPSKATLSSTNFLINESEIPPVENICDQVEQGQACLVQLGKLELVKKYGNVTALNEKGEPGNWEYQPKLTVLLGGQEGVDMTINGIGTFRVGFVLEMIDDQGVSLWGDSGDIRITVVPDSVALDQSHLAGSETKTDYVELTTTELEERMGNWNPETGVSSIKYDANKMVTDLFGAKVIGADNPIVNNLAFAVTNTSDLDGIVNSQIGEYKIDVALGLTRNNQVVKTLTLVVKEPVVDVPVVENTVAPKTTDGSGVQTGSDNNVFIALLMVIVASTMLLMLRRFRKE